MQPRVLVLDMQPITPTIGGGRQRLRGVFGSPPPEMDVTYLGTYDWEGEKKLDIQHSSNFRELLIPLSGVQHEKVRQIQLKHGVHVIDLLFHRMVRDSTEFMNQLRILCRLADVLVFSHPWLFPVVREEGLLSGKFSVYDSHNVESSLRDQLLPNTRFGREVSREVRLIEELAVKETHLVTCCSQEDATEFASIFGVPPSKLVVIENGATRLAPRTSPSGARRKKAIFLGSGYGPNNEAGLAIESVLAPAMPSVDFVIAGSVCAFLDAHQANAPANVLRKGVVSESVKNELLRASDFALNLVPNGSGTNIKMFDYLFSALPIVTTQAGSRGIDEDLLGASEVVTRGEELKGVRCLLESLSGRQEMATSLAAIALNRFEWNNISCRFYQVLKARYQTASEKELMFSVVVPTFERAHLLKDLCSALLRQEEKDFEVIIVDQSAIKKAVYFSSAADDSISISYNHVPFRGAVLARNHGASLARGKYLAFIDDDCIPDPDWLKVAKDLFLTRDIIGIEGEVYSEFVGQEGYRWVSNSTVTRGYMTANLIVEASCFREVGGFNRLFDQPHFREDTELGLRMEKLGTFLRSKEVRVFHPAHSSIEERESKSVRSAFFRKDAWLFKLKPEDYERIFADEEQWVHNPSFLRELAIGFVEIGMNIPDFILERMESQLLVQV